MKVRHCVPAVEDGGCRDGAPAPSASTKGNVECCPEADGTGVPSLHSLANHAARRVRTMNFGLAQDK